MRFYDIGDHAPAEVMEARLVLGSAARFIGDRRNADGDWAHGLVLQGQGCWGAALYTRVDGRRDITRVAPHASFKDARAAAAEKTHVWVALREHEIEQRHARSEADRLLSGAENPRVPRQGTGGQAGWPEGLSTA